MEVNKFSDDMLLLFEKYLEFRNFIKKKGFEDKVKFSFKEYAEGYFKLKSQEEFDLENYINDQD
jgi:hypothetical protein